MLAPIRMLYGCVPETASVLAAAAAWTPVMLAGGPEEIHETDLPILIVADAGVAALQLASGGAGRLAMIEGSQFWYPFADGSDFRKNKPVREKLTSSTYRRLAFGVLDLKLEYTTESGTHLAVVKFRLTPSAKLMPIWSAIERDLGNDALELLWQWRQGHAVPNGNASFRGLRGAGVLAGAIQKKIVAVMPHLAQLSKKSRDVDRLFSSLKAVRRRTTFESLTSEDRFVCGSVSSWLVVVRLCVRSFGAELARVDGEIAVQSAMRDEVEGYRGAQDDYRTQVSDRRKTLAGLVRRLQAWLIARAGKRCVPPGRFNWTPKLVHSMNYRAILDADREIKALAYGARVRPPTGVWSREFSRLFEVWAFDVMVALLAVDGWVAEAQVPDSHDPNRLHLPPIELGHPKGHQVTLKRGDSTLTMMYNHVATPRIQDHACRGAKRIASVEKNGSFICSGWYTSVINIEPDYAIHMRTARGEAVVVGDALARYIPDDAKYWATKNRDVREPDIAAICRKASKVRDAYSDAMWYVSVDGDKRNLLLPISELAFTIFPGPLGAAEKVEKEKVNGIYRASGHLLPLLPDPARSLSGGLSQDDPRLQRLKVLVESLEKHALGLDRLLPPPQ